MKLLLEYEAVISYTDYDYMTPFLHAYQTKNLEIMEILLNANNQIVDDLFEDGDAVLMKAVNKKEMDVINLLCQYSPNVQIRNDENKDVFDIMDSTEEFSEDIREQIENLKLSVSSPSKLTAIDFL